MSEEQPGSSQETKMDPRLLSPGVGIEVNLQEMVEQAQEIRTQMSCGSLAGAGQQKGSKIHIPEVSEELITKVDNILSIVQNLQTSQREIYNYVRAMAPKHSIIQTAGPIEHLETTNQINSYSDNAYWQQYRKFMKK